MSSTERLKFHQKHSKPLMDDLKEWLEEKKKQRIVEPNSAPGDAIQYMDTHWEKLTLFLRVPGAPIDNSICERILKKAILHRKNSLFFKTMNGARNGARVGDTFMSLIHTCELNGVDPFDFLVSLLRHHDEVKKSPADWLPWNYRETLAALKSRQSSCPSDN
jgi:hypothetical protein